MPKRAAPAPAPAKLAKSRREEAPAPWQPVEDLIAQARGEMSAGCVNMLQSALPFLLNAKKTDRHRFQETVLTFLSDQVLEEETKRRNSITVAEADVEAFEKEKAESASLLETAQAEEEVKKDEKEAKSKVIEEKTTILRAKEETHKAQLAKLEEAESNVKAATNAKQDFEAKVTSNWPAVKDVTFEKKDWRQRNKAIDAVVDCLQQAEAPESLQHCVVVVLKAGTPETRNVFHQATIEHAENAMNEHAAKLDKKIDELKVLETEHTNLSVDTEKACKEAQVDLDSTITVAVEAENAWVDANSKVFGLQTGIASFAERGAVLAKGLMEATNALEVLQSLQAKFQELVEGKETEEASLVKGNQIEEAEKEDAAVHAGA